MSWFERIIIMLWLMALTFVATYDDMQARTINARSVDLNKRSQILLQEFGKLDRRLRKQEGIKHGFGLP